MYLTLATKILIISSFFFVSYNINAQCHIGDWTALKALYKTTNGDNWTNKTGWTVLIANRNSPPTNCNFNSLLGVKTSTINNGRVAELSIGVNNLNGTLPAELGNLTYLKHLDLTGNKLKGNIPAQLGNLTNLTLLDLYENQLSGNIPSELGNLVKLNDLLLSNNQLTGSIPREIGNLSNLSILTLYSNGLSGCYSAALSNLCNQLNNVLYEGNAAINNGNNFNADWNSFCETNAGACLATSCEANILITRNTPFKNLYQSKGTISTQGAVVIKSGKQVEYWAKNEVILNNGFAISKGAEFIGTTKGACQ